MISGIMTVCVAGQIFLFFTTMGMIVNFNLIPHLRMVRYLCSCDIVGQVQYGIADRR